MNKRGNIISKKYERETKEEIKDYVVLDHNLNIKFKFENGVIHFDERKSHIVNCRQILKHYYDIEKEFTYEDTEFLKKKINNLDGHEIYLSNMLASIGEITILYADYQEEEKEVSSTMLFLPQNIDLLTENQISKTKTNLLSREEDYFEAVLCDGNVDNFYFLNKNEVFEILDKTKTPTKL